MTDSMGPIVDRTGAHLSASDVMLSRARRRLQAAVRSFVETGETPVTVDHPEVYRTHVGSVQLPRDVDWWEGTRALREPFREHPELDWSVTGGM